MSDGCYTCTNSVRLGHSDITLRVLYERTVFATLVSNHYRKTSLHVASFIHAEMEGRKLESVLKPEA